MSSSVTGSTLRLPKAQRRDPKIWFWSLFLSQEAIFSPPRFVRIGGIELSHFYLQIKRDWGTSPYGAWVIQNWISPSSSSSSWNIFFSIYLNITSVQRIRFYQIFCFQSLNTFSFICERKFWNALSHTLRIQLRLRELHCRSRAVQCRSLVTVVNLNVDHS